MNKIKALFRRDNLYLAFWLSQIPLLVGMRQVNPISVIGFLLFFICCLSQVHKDKKIVAFDRILNLKTFYIYLGIFSISWVVFALVSFNCLFYSIFDTGIYANLVSNFINTGTFYSGVHGKHAFSNHFTPILAIVAPILELWPSAVSLIVVKVVAYSVAALVLLKLSAEMLGKQSGIYILIPLLWVVHLYVGKVVAFEFQASSLAAPFIFLSFLFAVQHRYKSMFFVLLILLAFKEHLALIWVSLGIFIFITQADNRKLGALLVILGISIGVIIYTVVMPSFSNSTELSHYHRFGPLTFLPDKLNLIFKGLLSVGFIPLLYPITLLYIIPAFGLSLVSSATIMLGYSYHYQDIALCVLFVACLHALKAVQTNQSWLKDLKGYRGVLVCVCLTILLTYNAKYPMREIKKRWSMQKLEIVSSLKKLDQDIDPKAKVYSLNTLGAFLYKNTELKTIINIDALFPLKNIHSPDLYIVLSPHVNKWPLSEERFNELVQSLDSRAAKGKLQRIDRYPKLLVYRRTAE